MSFVCSTMLRINVAWASIRPERRSPLVALAWRHRPPAQARTSGSRLPRLPQSVPQPDGATSPWLLQRSNGREDQSKAPLPYMLASDPARILNQIRTALGIPCDSIRPENALVVAEVAEKGV